LTSSIVFIVFGGVFILAGIIVGCITLFLRKRIGLACALIGGLFVK
jgi:hypothetical protein